jgi:hypothetical protein
VNWGTSILCKRLSSRELYHRVSPNCGWKAVATLKFFHEQFQEPIFSLPDIFFQKFRQALPDGVRVDYLQKLPITIFASKEDNRLGKSV